jgi:hypothetical protein
MLQACWCAGLDSHAFVDVHSQIAWPLCKKCDGQVNTHYLFYMIDITETVWQKHQAWWTSQACMVHVYYLTYYISDNDLSSFVTVLVKYSIRSTSNERYWNGTMGKNYFPRLQKNPFFSSTWPLRSHRMRGSDVDRTDQPRKNVIPFLFNNYIFCWTGTIKWVLVGWKFISLSSGSFKLGLIDWFDWVDGAELKR